MKQLYRGDTVERERIMGIATVDVTYPSIPLFLLYAPVLVEGMLEPVFQMVYKGLWYYVRKLGGTLAFCRAS